MIKEFGSGSLSLTNGVRIREVQKHMDPTDPDPGLQHCFSVYSDPQPLKALKAGPDTAFFTEFESCFCS
jgi:hypothetical protein